MIYAFGVGHLVIKKDSSIIKEVDARSINVEYNITTHREIGPNGEVLDEFKDEESLNITAEWTDTEFSTSLASDDYYDITIQPGYGGSGFASITFARCKITKYAVNSSSGEFVIVSIGVTKTGSLNASPGEEPTKQKVKFGSVYLGDSATVSVNYEGNVQSIVIPTALGILVRSTQEMGGGGLSITVNGYVKKNTRLELEQYLINLYSLLSTTAATLTVEYGLTSYIIPNCTFSRASMGGDKVYSNFQIEFVKSAY